MRNYPIEEEEEEEEEEDRWELARAFEEDAMIRSTTWPPRSYTCSFCMREFRSAQPLGGHMNVHRRDRARLHMDRVQAQYQTRPINTAPISSLHGCCSSNGRGGGGHRDCVISVTEICPNYYNYNCQLLDSYNYSGINNCSEGNCFPHLRSDCFPAACSRYVSNKSERFHITEMSNNGSNNDVKLIYNEEATGAIDQELDLELRLGHIPA